MLLDRVDHVLRTSRSKTTLTPQQRTYPSLVKLDHSNQYPSQSFSHPVQPCSLQNLYSANTQLSQRAVGFTQQAPSLPT